MRVLLVDDEKSITAPLERGLRADGFSVTVAHDGLTAADLLTGRQFDVLVLDIMLPGLSGYELLKRIRGAADWTPVLMLSAKDGDHDIADALDLGADDYLIKPFSYVVLLARLRSVARRGRNPRPTSQVFGTLEIVAAKRLARVGGTPVTLSEREYQLLSRLAAADGAPVGKSSLLADVFEADPDGDANVVEVYVRYLRKKLGRERIVTVPGGYRLSDD